MDKDFVQLNRKILRLLRNGPLKYDLKLDEQGWVPITELLTNLQRKDERTKNFCASDIKRIVEHLSKERHEIKSEKIRALYDHSLTEQILEISLHPPRILYHGASLQTAELISKVGLKPIEGRYLPLSYDVKTALDVSDQRKANPVLLMIRAREAEKNGAKFYLCDESIWLANNIPPEYINLSSKY